MYYLLILLTFLCKRLEYENGRSIGCTCFVFYFTEINYIIIIIIIIINLSLSLTYSLNHSLFSPFLTLSLFSSSRQEGH